MESSLSSSWVFDELRRLEEQTLQRDIPPVDYGADLRITWQGRRVLNLASNNYLGLSRRPDIIDAAQKAVDQYGAGAGASRLVTGNYFPYQQLEQEIADFKGQESALVLGSGFATNLAILAALANRNTVVYSDRLNHASIIDGIKLSGAKHVRYRHNDMAHLAQCMEQHRDARRALLVTDSVFSMDGDIAPLKELVALCKARNTLIIVDEAHSTGVHGQGRGLAHEQGLSPDIHVHMGTFSKAFGSYGGFVAGAAPLIDLIRNKGRSFIFSTALPPAVIGANLAAVRFVREHPDEGARLLNISADIRHELLNMGFDVGDSVTQIIPIMMQENEAALSAREFLLERGVLVAAIRPPTVPQGAARLRLSLRADIDTRGLELLLDSFAALKQEYGA